VSNHTPFDEQVLVARAIDGDEGAFTALYDHFYDRIFRHVYYRVGRSQDAEDLTQQVFLQAWRALSRYQQKDTPFVAWLFAIAHNTIVSFYRRQKSVQSLDAEPFDWPDEANVEGLAEVTLEHDRVRVAMLTLKPEHQQVLVMRFLEDLPFKEIAGALGKTEVNIRVMQHRALQELRRKLGQPS
jgi:RNA polymerase sigma-70 factor, ECF subfamily